MAMISYLKGVASRVFYDESSSKFYKKGFWVFVSCRQNSFEDQNKDIKEMETEDAYGMVLNAVAKWGEHNMDPKSSKAFFVTMPRPHTQ